MYDMGVRLLIVASKTTDLETHYLNKYNIYTVIIISKFTRRRLSRMFKARGCVSKDYVKEDLGYVKLAEEIEIGGSRVTRFVQRSGESCLSTIVVRGASDNAMSDVRRACFDGINTIRAMCRESAFVPGAGSTEIELARLIADYGAKTKGLEQYAIKAFAEAFEDIPRTLAANSGMDFEDTIAKLYAAHSSGGSSIGIDVIKKDVVDATKSDILDLLVTKNSL